MVLKITVKTLDSQNYRFEANDDWSVKQFKECIEPIIQVPFNEQRLIFCGRVLQDDKKLTEYDCNGKVIHLVRRPPPSSDGPNSSTADSNNNTSNFSDNGNENHRFLDESNVLFSAMTLGPENVNVNHILRHMLSLQQAILGRADGVAAVSTMEPASMTDMERHLHNATRLLRITVNTINECMVRIAALPPVAGQRTTVNQAQSSLSPHRTVITAASSQTDLQRNDAMHTDEATNQEATSRGRIFVTTVDDMGVGGPAGAAPSHAQRVNAPRQSLTTDDLPPINVSPTPRVIPLIRNQTENRYPNVPNAQQRGEADLDRYLSILNYSCDLQNQFQGLLRRYRQLTDMSRRGGLIVPQQAHAQTTALDAPNSSSSSSSSSPAPNTEPLASESNQTETRTRSANRDRQGQLRGLTSTLMEEARILGVYVPRIMHHISHLQHALSDFSVDFAHGRLDEVEGRRRQTARRSTRPRYSTTRDLSGSRTSARHSTSTNRAQSAGRATASRDSALSGRGSSLEGSVTITATTVEATPVVTTSTSGSNMAQTNATFVVTADPRQAGIRIPVPIPLPIGSHGSITMDFTPIVTSRSRAQSLREAEGIGTESGAGHQNETNRQSGNNQQQQSSTTRSQQATTSNSTQTANRPFGVISGRIPIPFDYFLPCFSPWATYSVSNQTVRPNEMQPTRITVRTPHTQSAAPQATTNAAAGASAPPQTPRNVPVSDGGLSEVVSNIVGSFFRPQQGPAQQGTNSSVNNNQDPLLSMLPGIAINAATQLLGGVFGIPPIAGQQQGSPQTATGVRQASTLNNTSVMMDIDIDDSSSSQSESRYHDANETQPSAPNQTASEQRPTLTRQYPWLSSGLSQLAAGHSQSSSSSHSTNQQSTPAANTRYDHRHLAEVMRNHPDWIPIIESDISVMEQNQQSAANNQPFFSDAYLSSIPRKRRRLLTATPERVLILQPSPSQAISNILRRAIMNSNSTDIESLEQVLSSISNDPELHTAYEEHIRTAVEVRLKSDYDYCPKKFEHSNKYYK